MSVTKDCDELFIGGVSGSPGDLLGDTQVAKDRSLGASGLLTTRPQFPQKRALPGNSDPQNSQHCIVIPWILKMPHLYSPLLTKVTQRVADFAPTYSCLLH